MALKAEHFGRERSPFGTPGGTDEFHTGLFRSASAFSSITAVTRANNIAPGRDAALRARQHVVEVEFGAGQTPTAVLTGIIVTREDIEAREAHVTLGDPLVGDQQKNPRYADYSTHDAKPLMVNFDRKSAPAVEIESPVLLVNRFGNALVQESESPLYGSDVNRKIRAIEDEYSTIKQSRAIRLHRDSRLHRCGHLQILV